MAKIPTYQTRALPSGRTPRPNLPDYSVDITRKLVKTSNQILDAKAEREGLQAGFEAIEQGTTTIEQAEASSMTIRGDAFKKGARGAFVAKTKNELETELTKLYADTELQADPEKFATKTAELRDKIANTTPSSIAPLLMPEIDSAIGNYNNRILALSIATEDANNTAIQKDRFETIIIPRIQKNIAEGKRVDTDLGESLAILENLRDTNKITMEEFLNNKNILFQTIVEPFFESKFKNAPNGADFLEQFKNGEIQDEIMAELYEQYGDEFEAVTGEGSFPKILDEITFDKIESTLTKFVSDGVKSLKTERTVWETGLTTKIEDSIVNGKLVASEINFVELTDQMNELQYNDEEKEALETIWKTGALISEFTENLSTLNMDTIEERILSVDTQLAELENADATDIDTNVKLEALNKAKEYLVAKQSELLTNYADEKIYSYLKVTEAETTDTVISELFQKSVFELTEEDLIKRRELAAQQLGLDNVEAMPLLDASEINLLKETLTQATSPEQLRSAIELAGQLNLPANIYLEMKLEPELESMFILNGMQDKTAFNFAAEAYLQKADNLKAANITKKDAQTAAVEFLETDTYEGIKGDVTVVNAMTDLYASFYAKALAQTGDEDQANKIAQSYFQKVFRVEDAFNGQTLLVPNSISATEFGKTLEYAEEMLNNPVKYGIILDTDVGVTDFDLAENTIIVRDGDKLMFQIANKNDITSNDDGNLSYYQIQHGGKNGKAIKEVLAINVDPKSRINAPTETESNPAWSVVVADKSEAPALENNTANWEKHYFDLAVAGGYGIDNVERFATNIEPTDRDKQVILTGIAVRMNDGVEFSQDEMNWLNTNYPEVFDGMMIPEVQEEIKFLFNVFKESGGYSTLRTGKKLSPLATLYVVHQEAYVKYLEDRLTTLKSTTGEAENIFDADPNTPGVQFFNTGDQNTQKIKNEIKEIEAELKEEK